MLYRVHLALIGQYEQLIVVLHQLGCISTEVKPTLVITSIKQ